AAERRKATRAAGSRVAGPCGSSLTSGVPAPRPMARLASTVAVVTGASSRIGAETARALAAEGASVVLAARRADRLHALADEIGPDRALVVPTDVTRQPDCEALVGATLDRFGRLDVLVNNAGVMPLSFVKNVRVEEWTRMVEVNVNGVLFMT